MNIKDIYQLFLQHPIICTDTRTIAKDSIFFALKGENFNGNKFAQQALQAGCAYAIIDEAPYAHDNRLIKVNGVLQTLQDLAQHHRRQFNIPVIAITGSNGKTTSKELTNAVLCQKYNVLATKGNLNNHIGVPLTLLQLNTQHQVAIIEMGANHQGEINILCHIAEPTYGMITNIGKAHLEGFGGIEGVIKGKSEMYHFLGKNNATIFVNADNDLLLSLSENYNRICYGTNKNVDFAGEMIATEPYLSFCCSHASSFFNSTKKEIIHSHLIGKYNFENLLAAACIGNHLELSINEIKMGIENYIPSNNRSQLLVKGSNELILDAYNANPSSMKAAIENFALLKKPNKLLILGDMLELGDESAKEHQYIVDLIKEKNISCVYLVGKYFGNINNHLSAMQFESAEEISKHLRLHPINNSTILIKGSRGTRLEKILEVL
jgi:UDP-N-acetylmuramoyl-tripeptide--D-alanyl-D-alanine ligase